MSLYEKLKEGLPIRVLEHNGFKYVAAHDVRDRMNNVFDCNWSFKVKEVNPNLTTLKSIEDISTIVVLGQVSVMLDGVEFVKEAFGGCDVKKFTKGARKGQPVDIAMDFQSAAVDALKACCKLLGVGDAISNGDVGSHKPKFKITSASKPEVEPNRNTKPVSGDVNGTKDASEQLKEKIRRLKAKNTKGENKVVAEPKPDVAKSEDEEEPHQEGRGFSYEDNQPDTLAVKKVILQNFATNKGLSVDKFITAAYGDAVSLDTITEEQITAMINGDINVAATGE